MSCRRAQRWVSRELDGALDARRASELARHLELCPTCRAFRERCASLRALSREMAPSSDLSADAVWGEVRCAIRRGPAQTRREAAHWDFSVWVRTMTAAAALALVLGGAAALWHTMMRPADSIAVGRVQVEWLETGLPDAMPMVYQDEETGWTVIWIVEANGSGEKNHAGT